MPTLIRALPPGGIAVVNADDPFVEVWRDAARQTPGVGVVEFGLEFPAAIRGRSAATANGMTLDLSTPGRRDDGASSQSPAATTRPTRSPRRPRRSRSAFRWRRSRKVSLRFGPCRDGSRRCAPRAGAAVIDDTYNANPDSVRAAIAVLGAAPSPKWLVLGDMGEVGPQGPAFHREVGLFAREAGVDRLLDGRRRSRPKRARRSATGADHFASVDALARHVASSVGPEVTVLIKGSRFMQMERVVSALAGTEIPPERPSHTSLHAGRLPGGGPSDGEGAH